jgi:ADP-ribosylglycohydrolase
MIMAGASIAEAYESSKHLTTEVLREHVGRAIEVGKLAPPSPEVIDTELGAGWVAEEALAIAVACAVSAPDLERGLLASVNHSGDTDSTGSICGNLLGAAHGVAAIPIGWINALDGADLIEMIADDCVLWVVGEPRSDVPDPDFAHLFGRYVA